METKLKEMFPEAQKERGCYKIINGDMIIQFEKGEKAGGNSILAGLCCPCTDVEETERYWTKLGLQRNMF